MAEPTPDAHTIVAAFAARAKLNLTEAEHERLVEYVSDSWDMADRLRDVQTPGYEGMAEKLPLRAAYSNRGSSPASASPSGSESVGTPRPLPEGVLEGGVVVAARAMAAGEYSPLDLVNGQLERIARFDDTVRSYITVDREGSLAAASGLTEELGSGGPRSPLHGIPFGAKDSIPAAGMPTTYNSPLTKDWVPKRDSEAVR